MVLYTIYAMVYINSIYYFSKLFVPANELLLCNFLSEQKMVSSLSVVVSVKWGTVICMEIELQVHLGWFVCTKQLILLSGKEGHNNPVSSVPALIRKNLGTFILFCLLWLDMELLTDSHLQFPEQNWSHVEVKHQPLLVHTRAERQERHTQLVGGVRGAKMMACSVCDWGDGVL